MKNFAYDIMVPIISMRDRQTKQILVSSPALDLSSCGKTEAQAIKAFSEAVRLFFSELEDMGTTEDVLIELGWRRLRSPGRHWVPPEILPQKQIRVPAAV